MNIGTFNEVFSKNIQSFDATFGKKVDLLKAAVSDISQSIGVITEGNRTQKEFLIEIRKKGYVRMAEVSTEFFEKVTEAAPLLSNFIERQETFTTNINNINDFAERITGLLNRVVDFEYGINELGRNFQQSDLLGSEVLMIVSKHLTAIQQKERLIEDYSLKATDSVKEYLQNSITQIADLKRSLEIQFENAFKFDTSGNVLQKLNHLSVIEQELSNLIKQDASRKIDPELSKQLSDIKAVLEEIKADSASKDKTTQTLIAANAVPKPLSEDLSPIKDEPSISDPESGEIHALVEKAPPVPLVPGAANGESTLNEQLTIINSPFPKSDEPPKRKKKWWKFLGLLIS